MILPRPKIFKLDNHEYNIICIKGCDFLNLRDIYFGNVCALSGCFGEPLYQYAIKNNELILAELYISLGNFDDSNNFIAHEGNLINGVQPIFIQYDDDGYAPGFNNKYQDLNLKINFTGGMLIGSDWEFRNDDFFIPGRLYENLLELVFENGKVLSIEDFSQEIAVFKEEYPYSKFRLLSFTQREETILKSLIEGLSSPEVAVQMGRTVTAINFYIQKLLEKTNIDDLAKLIKYANRYYGTNEYDELLLKWQNLRLYFGKKYFEE